MEPMKWDLQALDIIESETRDMVPAGAPSTPKSETDVEIAPLVQRVLGASNDPPPLKWSDLRYVFDIQEDCNGKEAIQA